MKYDIIRTEKRNTNQQSKSKSRKRNTGEKGKHEHKQILVYKWGNKTLIHRY